MASVRAKGERAGADGGFGLVELVVVVVVIAILVAIAVPTLRGAKTRSHDSAAASTLRSAVEIAGVAITDDPDALMDATAMRAEDRFVTYVDGAVASTGPREVSVRATGGLWVGVVRSESGSCFRASTGDAGTVAPVEFVTSSCSADAAVYGPAGNDGAGGGGSTTTTTVPGAQGLTIEQGIASYAGTVTFAGGYGYSIVGDVYSQGTVSGGGSPVITGNVRAVGRVDLQGAATSITGDVQSNTDRVRLASGSHVLGSVYAADTIETGTQVHGSARAGSSINTCSEVTGSCTQNSAPPLFTVPTTRGFVWNAANYATPTVWGTGNAFHAWLVAHASSLSGVHYVTGKATIDVPVSIAGNLVIVATDTLEVSSSITTAVASNTTALFVSTGSQVKVTGTVTGNAYLSVAFVSVTDQFTNSGTISMNGSIAARSTVSLAGDTYVTYSPVRDPGFY